MMKRTRLAKLLALLMSLVMLMGITGAALADEVADTFTIVSLKTNGRVDPIGIDSEIPEFSWQMASSTIGAAQTAYQIVVTDEAGATVWDSGKVEEAGSVGIKYAGDALAPATRYDWSVTVWDQSGAEVISDPASFETGLMSTSIDAWDGAQWIGAPELTLDAVSAQYFDIRTGITIQEGSTSASLILGADDFRLKNSAMNIDRLAGENYIRVELDVGNVTSEGGAAINIYRVGYVEGDSPDVPFTTISTAAIPECNIDTLITEANAHAAHELEIVVCASDMSISIDGTALSMGMVEGWGGMSEKTSVTLSQLGSGGNYNSFPNLMSIGFAAKPGEEAIFTDYQILNPGYNAGGVLFGADSGATYAIWDGIDGVQIDAGTITVSGGEGGLLCYADPSYGSAPMLRTEFPVDPEREIANARMYVTARGIYEMYINGERMGDDWFNPGNAEYIKHMPYQSYDVTDMLSSGQNAIGVQLAEGWWSGYMTFTVSNYNYYGDKQALMAKLVVEYTEGEPDVIVTNTDSWQYYGNGPVEYGSLFQGERYNAQKEVPGWAEPDFNAEGWIAPEINELGSDKLENYELFSRIDEPGHVVKTLTAKECLGEAKPDTGSYIYDMGENVIGVPSITIPEGYVDEGDDVIVRYAEILYPDNLSEYTDADIDGMLMVENYRAALSTDFYTAKAGDNKLEPHFTFHGARYIEISGLNEPLPPEDVQYLVLSSVEMTATYESSNELANRLFLNVQNSQTSNFLTLPTDCPQRNERMGWLGDAQVFSRAASYNADVLNFYRQWLQSLRDNQIPAGTEGAGYVPVTAPNYYTDYTPAEPGGGFAGVSWEAALTLIPWQMYRQYGDTDIIADNIDAIKLYLDYEDDSDFSEEYTYLTSKTGFLADWLSIDSTDAGLINNAVYIYLMDVAAQMAHVVSRDDIATELEERYALAKAEWNEVYVDPETGMTRTSDGEIQNTQASYATALVYGIFNEEYQEQAAEHLREQVVNPQNGTSPAYTITTGFSGTPNIVPALTNAGYIDDAYKLFESTEYASWLYPVTQGATSIWERWNSYTVEGGFNGNNSMNSFNHFSLGAISEWMMGYQLGITGIDEAPGYQKFILQPTPGGDYTNLSGSFESNYGTIKSAWTAEDGELVTYSAVVPANSSATLYLPVEATDIEAEVPGVTYVGEDVRYGRTVAVFELSAGGYDFSVADGSVTVALQEGYSD